MSRFKCRVGLSLDRGFSKKRDTPVKAALSRRDKNRRLLPNKHYEAFPEEPEIIHVKPRNSVLPLQTSIEPDHGKSTLCLSSPAFTENPKGKAVSPAAPANKKSDHQVSPACPDAKAFKGVEMPFKEEQNLAVTQDSLTFSSVASDTFFSCDEDDDEDDRYPSVSSTSSSLPSPEIFRKESNAETLTFPMKEELQGLHLHIKNSTLLEASHAESIHMHHPPNLSTIDASTVLAENNCDINQHMGPEADTKIHTDSFKSAFKWKTPPKLSSRKPILCKKKVWFKSPIIAETLEAKPIPVTKFTIFNTTEPVQTCIHAQQMKPDIDTCGAVEINSEEDASRLLVRLKRPIKCDPTKAKFFDFVDEVDRDTFFQKMRERCLKLRSAPSFPLTAAKYTGPSIL